MTKYRDNIHQNSFSSLILHLKMSPYSFSDISALGKRSKGGRPLPHCNLLILFFKQLIDLVCFGTSFSNLKAAVLSCSITDAPRPHCSAPGQRAEQLCALLGHEDISTR